MAALKTVPNDASVDAFLDAIDDDARRDDCRTVRALMERVTGEPATMWGDSIVGFGSYHYRYASGREGDWMLTGFSPRKRSLTLYLMAGFDGFGDLLGRLGPHKTAKACLYLNRLDDVDLDVLEALVSKSVESTRRAYPAESG